MTTTELLAKLAARCITVSVSANSHADATKAGMTPREFYVDMAAHEEMGEVDWSAPVLWSVQAYPNTTVGSYAVVGTDLRLLLIGVLESCGPRRPVA